MLFFGKIFSGQFFTFETQSLCRKNFATLLLLPVLNFSHKIVLFLLNFYNLETFYKNGFQIFLIKSQTEWFFLFQTMPNKGM